MGAGILPERLGSMEDSKLEEEGATEENYYGLVPAHVPNALCHVAGQGRGVGRREAKLRLGKKKEEGGILGFVFASQNPTPF